MQEIAEDEQRMMVLIYGVTGAAETWLRQRRTIHPGEDFSMVIRTLEIGIRIDWSIRGRFKSSTGWGKKRKQSENSTRNLPMY
jgi:hypothetical protein